MGYNQREITLEKADEPPEIEGRIILLLLETGSCLKGGHVQEMVRNSAEMKQVK